MMNLEEFTAKYFDLLTNEFSGINLTRIIEFDEFNNKQIKDSIWPTEQSKCFADAIDNTKLVIDVGFGGGFPILPLAFKYQDKKFIGIESRKKKVDVVTKIAKTLNLNNTVLYHSRIEEILIDKECVITFKAVGKVQDFLALINTKAYVKVFFYKGPNYSEQEGLTPLLEKSWKKICEDEIKIDGIDKRLIVGFENIIVPCGTNISKVKKDISKIKYQENR